MYSDRLLLSAQTHCVQLEIELEIEGKKQVPGDGRTARGYSIWMEAWQLQGFRGA